MNIKAIIKALCSEADELDNKAETLRAYASELEMIEQAAERAQMAMMEVGHTVDAFRDLERASE